MNKFKTLIATGVALVGVGLSTSLGTAKADAYTVDTSQKLAPNEGSSQRANPNYIILHETANPNAGGLNNAKYMKRTWYNAYTAYIVGEGKAYQVGEDGYVQYGAGSYANANSPVQIELDHTTDPVMFQKNYKVYVELARDKAKKYNIPLTLDTPYNQRGIKSHLWVTQNIWGDHSDPYGYLQKMGISKQKLAHDLANGFGSDTNNPAPKPQPSNPQTAHDNAVTKSAPVANGNYIGKLDVFKEQPNGQLRIAGWNVAVNGADAYRYGFVFYMDANTGKEVARSMSAGISRPDVSKAYGLPTSNKYGLDTTVSMKKLKGHKIIPMFRRTNDPSGNTKGGAKDVMLPNIYINVPK